jgi:hypothetical protein
MTRGTLLIDTYGLLFKLDRVSKAARRWYTRRSSKGCDQPTPSQDFRTKQDAGIATGRLSMYARIIALFIALSAMQFASGQEKEFDEVANAFSPIADKAKPDKTDFVAVPLPMSNPTLGTGLAGGVMALYPQKGDAPSSNTIVGGFYTSSNSWAIGASQKNYLRDDRIRLTAIAAYADLKFDFWGIGTDAGDNDVFVGINQTAVIFKPELLWETFDDLFVGPQFVLLYGETSADASLPGEGGPDDIVNATGDLVNVGLGLATEYDTRDNPLNATTGWFVEGDILMYRKSWGSDIDYERYVLTANNYLRLTESQVLAWQVSGCATNGDAPFYQLCMFGASRIIRGYPVGRYLDARMLAGQAEWRWSFRPRWGMVAFGGLGQVAKNFSDFESDNILVSGGVGLRWMASVENRINLSVDYALGEHDNYIYIYVGEAF